MARGFRLRYDVKDGSISGERQFTALPIRIGRNPLNDCPISQQFVSHFHARLEEIDGKICVRDLGSKNGVLLRSGERVPPQTPVDLAPHGYEFWVGPLMHAKLEIVELSELPAQRADRLSGTVLGNRAMLESGLMGPAPAPKPSGSWGSIPVSGPAPPPPLAASLPPLPGAPPGQQQHYSPTNVSGGIQPPGAAAAASAYPAAHISGYGGAPAAPSLSGLPPLGAPGAPPPIAGPFGGGSARPSGYPAAPGAEVGKSTQHFGMATELLALLGLRELAGSLVPGQPLETTGDIARLVTKLHDAIEVFCRCFVPLREGYAQFVSQMDLQEAASQRTLSRSNAYRRVEYARDPAQVAAALLDWRDPSFDAPAAVEGIFADLMLHQVALLDGVMHGVRALLSELAPENIERAVDERRGLSLGRYRALWQAYCERFEELSDESEAFARIFGREFTSAYRERGQGRNQGEPHRTR